MDPLTFLGISVTVVATTYGVGSKWYAHKRKQLQDKQDLVHQLHLSLSGFIPICNFLSEKKSSTAQHLLPQAASNTLQSLSQAYERCRHIVPSYVSIPVGEITTLLSRLAWNQIRNSQELHHDLKRINQLYEELTRLCGKHEEMYKVRNDVRTFLHGHLQKIAPPIDRNLIICSRCTKSNWPYNEFCIKCGKELRSTKDQESLFLECSKCRVPNETDSLRCKWCGNSLDPDKDKRSVVLFTVEKPPSYEGPVLP